MQIHDNAASNYKHTTKHTAVNMQH